ncbi:MAG: helix-turn-helix domain-containing protein, partial [Alicyclobacillus sp.]|nr:helix-turn-helix domain-containing protein [Alicyclobacillus sp.]
SYLPGRAFGRTGQNVRVHVLANTDVTEDRPLRPTPAYIGMDEITLAKGKGKYRLVLYDMSVPWRSELFTMLTSRKLEDVTAFVQVKYEMLRAHHVQGEPVSQVARRFGFSRQTFYATDLAFKRERWRGLLHGKPGPRGPNKITPECAKYLRTEHHARPDASWDELAQATAVHFGISVHPRTVQRLLDKKNYSQPTLSDQSHLFIQDTDRFQAQYEKAREEAIAGMVVSAPCIGARVCAPRSNGAYWYIQWDEVPNPVGADSMSNRKRLTRIIRNLLFPTAVGPPNGQGDGTDASGHIYPSLICTPGAGENHCITSGSPGSLRSPTGV